MPRPGRSRWAKARDVAIVLALLPLLLVVLPVVLLAQFLYSVALHLAVWLLWLPRGKRLLFVYSDSPVWRDYLASEVLPHIQQRAVVLNWSERHSWSRFPSLAHMVFYHFGGSEPFNPLAVVFRPWRTAKVLRFWEPFKEYKHGKPERLQALQVQLLDLVR